MAGRRILYSAALAGALLFQITNDNYLARFLLALCVALPLLSLVLSLPGMVKCRVILSPRPAELERGDKGSWTVEVDTFAGLPLSRVTLRLRVWNWLTMEWSAQTLKLTGVARRRPVEVPAPTGHCGALELEAERIRVCDYLGLFAWCVSPPPPCTILCRPIPVLRPPVDVPDGLRGPASPRSAAHAGPGEDYDLREYRPGDPMRAVHWKLSSKWDELIVRERAEAAAPLPLLTMDLSGEADRLDKLLDQLTGLSRAMLAAQRPHAVLWVDWAGEEQFYPVGDEGEYAQMLNALLRAQAVPWEVSLDEFPEALAGLDFPVFRVHVTPEGGDGHG